MNDLDFDEDSVFSSPFSENISLVDYLTSARDSTELEDPTRRFRSISELTLDTLWNEMDSVIPLLKLLPTLKEVNGFYVRLRKLISTQGTSHRLSF